jgi:mannose-1-phosphate guanylyltransferase
MIMAGHFYWNSGMISFTSNSPDSGEEGKTM